MKKLVPAPPSSQSGQRRNRQYDLVNQQILQHFNSRDVDNRVLKQLKKTTPIPVGRDSPFCVRAGVSAEEALVHVSLLLDCALQVSDEITEHGSGLERGLIWSMVHSVEMARAVVDALLNASRPTEATG
ncbi:hypothetical protein [Pseudomonas sp. Tri1]|uniref:hypothetical protein n=1 Tax=Pseudomonas sp. Tri1 TaxID=2823875 RepID=UPI001B3350F5|nr:hypothetical protein [Pseudomonas sp. Tri1]